MNPLFLAALVLFLFSLCLAAWLLGKRRRSHRVRHTQITRLQRAEALVDFYEADRARLADILTEDLAQSLAGVGLMLGSLRRRITGAPSVHRADVDALVRQTETSLGEARSILHSLRAASHPEKNLTHAIGALLAGQRRVPTTFRTEGNLPDAPQVALLLYDAAAEGVGNALRHAEPAHIDVQLAVERGGATITVEDDGRGFARAQGTPTVPLSGLRRLEAQAAVLGGSVEVDSSPGRGTVLTVWVPTPGGVPHEA